MQRQERSRSVRSTRSPSSSPVCLSPPSSSPSSSSSWSSGSSGSSSSSSWSSWAIGGSSITSSVLLWPLPLPTDSTATYDSSCSRLPSTLESLRFSTSSMSCPNLISVFTWSVMLLLISSCIGFSDAGILNGHPLGKRSFIDIQCKGIYDKSIFARLDRICEDCYNLFREPQLHQLCRKNCFTSDYFKGCLDVLLLQDEVEKIQTWIKHLHGAEPGV